MSAEQSDVFRQEARDLLDSLEQKRCSIWSRSPTTTISSTPRSAPCTPSRAPARCSVSARSRHSRMPSKPRSTASARSRRRRAATSSPVALRRQGLHPHPDRNSREGRCGRGRRSSRCAPADRGSRIAGEPISTPAPAPSAALLPPLEMLAPAPAPAGQTFRVRFPAAA